MKLTQATTIGVLLMTLLCPQRMSAQQPGAPAGNSATLKTQVDEVVLDIVARDKKGRAINDLKPQDITVIDDGAKQTLNSFRLVRGKDAITQTGTETKLDPLRQIRLVTLAFEPMAAADQRKMARQAALDLVKGEQGTNVFYSVVAINTRLLVLQQFTNDRAALTAAIDRITQGLGGPKLISESNTIVQELKRQLGPTNVNGADQNSSLLAAASQTASQQPGPGMDPTTPVLARIMLDMLRMDDGAVSIGTRLSLSALKSLVQGMQQLPGRKSVLYFTGGMYLPPELEVPYNNLISIANRSNVTFYSVDVRGVMIGAQNTGALSQLNRATSASALTVNRTSGAVTKEEIMAADTAETAGARNVQLRVRELAESTGGFLIGDTNDLRPALRKVNEEVSSYYEVTFNPGIQNYDGRFRKLKVEANRKDLVINARTGYFALPPEARAAGLQTFELPILKILSEGKVLDGVDYRAGAVILQPKPEATNVSVVVELPLRGLAAKLSPAGDLSNVHFYLGALVKDSKGEVVQKMTRDRSIQVTAEQLKFGNFVDKSTFALPPGAYTLESAVTDTESGKSGMHRSEFTVRPWAKSVALSTLTGVRSYTPGVKGLDPEEPFQFQGGSITPTLNTSVPRSPNSVLRLFFTVYPDAANPSKPTVDIEFLQNGKSLTKVPMPLPAADAEGRIPYVMTIPAASIPPGVYDIRATARQGGTSAETKTSVKIE
jgi:VWFA-related protein